MKQNNHVKKTGRQKLLWKEAMKEKGKREELYQSCVRILDAMRDSAASVQEFAAAAAALSLACSSCKRERKT